MGSIVCGSSRPRRSRGHEGRRPRPACPVTGLPRGIKPRANDPRPPQGRECGPTARLTPFLYAYKRQTLNVVGTDLC
jgi:hypothetical protein